MTASAPGPRRLLRQCGRQGLFRHAVATEWGGRGDRFGDLLEAHVQKGRECLDAGLILAINAHLWGAVFPLLRFGSAEQKARWLPGLIAGDLIGGHAITEPHAGSDPASMRASAGAHPEGFVLNGEKRYITNAPVADVMVVYARLETKPSAFVLTPQDPGFSVSKNHPTQACHAAAMGEIHLDDCRIPADRLLGKAGAGLNMIQSALEWERAFIFAGIAGMMEWQLERVIDFSRRRDSGPAHLGRHQAIAHRIADMRIRLDTLHLWLKKCARLADAGKRITLASAQTKVIASEAFLQSTLDAIHILGARGLEEENGMAGWLNDAAAGRLFSGSTEIQKNLIAALLGTGEGYKPKRRPPGA